MQKIVGLVVLSLIASTYGQIFPTNATQLTFGVPYLGALVPQPNANFYEIPSLFYIFVPMNVSSLTLTIAKTGSVCEYIDFATGVDGFQCADSPPTEEEYSDYFFCNRADDIYYTSSSTQQVFYPGTYDYDGGFNYGSFVAGTYFYITILRDDDDSSNNDVACTFNLTMTATFCPTTVGVTTVAFGDEDEAGTCVTATNIPVMGTAQTFTGTLGDTAAVYYLNLPPNTGNVMFNLSGNQYDVYIYGNNFQASTDSESGYAGSCYDYTSDTNTNGVYTASATCIGVQSGVFYIVIDNTGSSDSFAYTLSVTTTVCAEGTAGYYCNSTYFNGNQIFTAGGVNLLLQTGQNAYGYINASMYAGEYLYITATFNGTNSGSAYFYVQKNAFPVEDSSYESIDIGGISDPNTFVLSPFETYGFVPGAYPTARYYFGVMDCDEGPCSIHIGSNSTGAPSTTGFPSVTTHARVTGTPSPSMTGTPSPSMTGTPSPSVTGAPAATTGSAASIMPSVIAVIIAVIAAMF